MGVGAVERELIATGIGGQGVQLAAQVVARAAIHDGLDVMMFGSYGGMMRGGNTEASLVLSPGVVEAPPVVPACWIGMAMHHAFLPAVVDKLRPDGLLFTNSSVLEAVPSTPATVVPIAATDVAIDVGGAICASIVMVGVIAASTALLSQDALHAAVDEALPPYRQQHRDLNHAALDAGWALAVSGLPEAWPRERTPA